MIESRPQQCRVFVDDSIHDRDGFILTAAIITSDDLAPAIAQLLIEADLTLGIDEYKSHERSRRLRGELGELLYDSGARIALAVTPRNQREAAGADMLALLAKLKDEGALGLSEVSVWLDEGLLTKSAREWLECNPSHGLSIEAERNSKTVLELQLADLVAHTAATIIRCELGSISKMVPAGPNSGYDPDELFPLEFELWAGLRYNLAGQRTQHSDSDGVADSATCYAFGLFINEHCSPMVKDAAEKQLRTVFLGCIH